MTALYRFRFLLDFCSQPLNKASFLPMERKEEIIEPSGAAGCDDDAL
jgi:hypothetical protein